MQGNAADDRSLTMHMSFSKTEKPSHVELCLVRVRCEVICPHDSLVSECWLIPRCTCAPRDLVREILPLGRFTNQNLVFPKKNGGSWRVGSTFAISVPPSPTSAQLSTSWCILKDAVALTTSAELLFPDFLPILGAPGRQQTP